MYIRFISLLLPKAAVTAAMLRLLAPSAPATEVETSGRDPLPVHASAFAWKVETGLAIPLSKGFGESRPIDTDAAVESRENNRCAEFVVFFNTINKGKE